MDLTLKDLDSEEWALAHGLTMGMRNTIVPGLKLDQLTGAAVNVLVGFVDVIAGLDDPLVILYGWIRLRFTKACTDALYGVGNSFKEGTG